MELVSEVQKDASRTDESFHHWHLSRKIKSTSFIQKKGNQVTVYIYN